MIGIKKGIKERLYVSEIQMIKKIHIQNIATIKDAEIEPLQINYFFGGNGSGKTSISRFLNDSQNYNNGCIVKEQDSEVLIYNRDFVDRNFQDKNAIQGIFTIGESAVETLKAIEEQEAEKTQLQKELTARERSIEKLQSDINDLTTNFESNCWTVQQKIGEQFSLALVGFRGKKKIFSDQCYKSYSSAESQFMIEELLKTYQQIFQKDLKEYPLLNGFGFSVNCGEKTIDIESIETADVFMEKLVKACESNFSKFIGNLGSLDWVSQGMQYLQDGKQCPFCQREITEDILSELNLLFDETYNQSIAQLKELSDLYSQIIQEFEDEFGSFLASVRLIPFLNSEKVENIYAKLFGELQANQNLIKEKIFHPSIEVSLNSTKYYREELVKEREELNKQINNNNSLVKNKKTARNDFVKNLWNYIANKELHDTIADYEAKRVGKNRGMINLFSQRDSLRQKIKECEEAIRDLRTKVTCIDNAVDEINKILIGFGFTGFKIEKKTICFIN